MPELDFVTLDVFTNKRYGGNPLALVKVPEGRDVSTEQMQAIAREFNLSETIVLHEGHVGSDGVPEWRVRIFLPTEEIPFAGHPTIGAAVYALGTLSNNASKGRLLANAGPIELDFAHGTANASIPHNFHLHTQYPFTSQDVFALQPSLTGKLEGENAIDTVSPVRGMSFVTVELPDLPTLASITTSPKPSPKLDDAWNTGFAGSYFYVLLHRSVDGDQDGAAEYELRTRMIEGSFEDPATGSAACALSCHLALRHRTRRTHTFQITQAVEMGRRSDIGVTVTLVRSLDAVERVELRGTAVQVMQGRLLY